MGDNILAFPSPEDRRNAAGQLERAQQVAACGSLDYSIQILLDCCRLDPGNLLYRQTLRQTEKTRFRNNRRGSRLAFLTTIWARARARKARRSSNHRKVLEYGEEVLTRNPWDVGIHKDMADAADALGLLDVAIWLLEQARQYSPHLLALNRSLARLYEKRGTFASACVLWKLVSEADPSDVEASHKARDLGAVSGRDASSRQDRNGDGDRLARETAELRGRIEEDPTKVQTWLRLAALLRKAGQCDQARAVLHEALGPTGNDFHVNLELADLEIEPFRADLAIVQDKLAESADPKLEDLRGQLVQEINSREMDVYRQRSDRFPEDRAARFELGLRLLRAGRVDEAGTELDKVRGDASLAGPALFYLGLCRKQRKRLLQALALWEEALPLLTEDPLLYKEVLLKLAEGSAAAGEPARAVEWARELAHVSPGFGNIDQLAQDWQTSLVAANVPSPLVGEGQGGG